MDRILILDRDPDHAEALAASLRRADRSIERFSDERAALTKANMDGIDVLILVPLARSMWREQLQEICTALKGQFNRPAILCLLRWPPQEATDRLFGDSLGVEVQYEY